MWKDVACENIIENEEILSKAEEYQKNGLILLNSLHVACVVYAKCDVFITTDKGILKRKIDDIKVLNPIDFMRELINNDDWYYDSKKGIVALIKELWNVDAERFVNIAIKNPLDYTGWRKTNVHENISVRELSKKTMVVENAK